MNLKSMLITEREPGMEEAVKKLQGLFPERIEYGDWDVWDNLQNLNNMNVIAKDGDEIIGYVLCIPQEEAYGYLKDDDSQISRDPKMCYVDQICVVEDKRGGEVFRFLVSELAVEARKRGYTKWSSHLMKGMENTLGRCIKGKDRETKMIAYGDHELVYMEGFI